MRGRVASSARTRRALLACGFLLFAIVSGVAASTGRDAMNAGREAFRAGDWASAESAFREAVELDPGLIEAWRGLSSALRRQGRNDEAFEIVETLLKTRPDDAELLRAAGEIERARGRTASAVTYFRSAARADPSSIGAQLRLAEALEANGEGEASLAAYREVLSRSPVHVQATSGAARMIARTGSLEEAVAFLESRAGRVPGTESELARLYHASGDAAFAAERWEEAAAAYRKGLEYAPEHARLKANLGWAARRGGQSKTARRFWNEAIAADPALVPELSVAIADLETELGHPDAARRALERAADLGESNPQVQYRLLRVGFEMKDEALVSKQASALAESAGDDGAWALRIAELFVRHERLEDGLKFFAEGGPGAGMAGRDEAVAKLRQALLTRAYRDEDFAGAAQHGLAALEAAPDRAAVLRDTGWALWRAERWDEAERIWTRYAVLHPDDPEPHGLLARLTLNRRRYDAALGHTERELARAPESRLAQLRRVQALSGAGRTREAREVAETLAAAEPDDRIAQVRYAEILTRLLDHPAAERQWKRVLELDPDSERARLRWIRAMYESGREERARDLALDAVEGEHESESLLVFLAEDAEIREDHHERAGWLARLNRRVPERPEYWIQRIRALRAAGDSEARLDVAQETLERFPDRLEARLEYAAALEATGEAKAALREYRALHEAHPGNRSAYRGMMRGLIATRRYDEAIDSVDANRGAFVNDYEPAFWRASALGGSGRAAASVDAIDAFRDDLSDAIHVPILVYHGLSKRERTLGISQATFEAHMRALVGAGYTAITVTDLAAMIDGRRSVPERPVLITFDDARMDTFELVDPVLERLRLKATMFVPTGLIGGDDLFHAGWDTLARLAATGRWELQAHGHRAHTPVAVDGDGTTGKFLVDRAWIEEVGRLESREEFESRLDEDYRLARDRIERGARTAAPIAYAFPYNELGQLAGGTEREAVFINERLHRRYYRFGVVQDSVGYNSIRAGDGAPRLLWRFEPSRSWSGDELLEHLVAHEPRFQARLQAAWRLLWADRADAARETLESLEIRPGAVPAIARLRAELAWQEGRPFDSARHLSALPASGVDAFRRSSLGRRLPWRLDPNLAFAATSWTDSEDRDHQRAATRFAMPLGWPLELGFEAAAVRFAERGLPTVDGFEYGLTAARPLGRRFELSGWTRHRALDVADSSWGGGGELQYRRNRHRAWVAWAARDIETVDALLDGTEEIFGGAGYSRRQDRWSLRTEATVRDVEDDNRLFRGRATVLYRVGRVPGLEVGGDLELADSRVRVPEYYSPQDLRSARARADYRRGFRDGSSMTFGAGFGFAEDDPNGSRWIGNVRVAGFWNLTDRVRAIASVSTSTNPEYRSTRAEFTLGWRPSAWSRRDRLRPDGPERERLAATDRY